MERTLAHAVDAVDRVPGGHLATCHGLRHGALVFRRQQLPLTERDVNILMGALLDIRANTEEILNLLRDDGAEEEEDS